MAKKRISEREKIARNFGKKSGQDLKSFNLDREIRVLKSVILRPKEFDWYYRAKAEERLGKLMKKRKKKNG